MFEESKFMQTRYAKRIKKNWYIFKTRDVNYYLEDKTIAVFTFYEIKLDGDYKTWMFNCTGVFKDKDDKLCERVELSRLGYSLYLEREDLYDYYIDAIKRLNNKPEGYIDNGYDREIKDFIARHNKQNASEQDIVPLDLCVKKEVDEYLGKEK